MLTITSQLKELIRPYKLDSQISNLVIFMPRAVSGYFLSFVYAAENFGVPWSPDYMNLQPFELNPRLVEDVTNFGPPFDLMPLIFSSSAVITMGIGGILMIIGLNTRITSFFIVITMFFTILFREWNSDWRILPTFILFCIGLFYLGFGSGKYGLDYYVSRRCFN